MKKDGRTQCKRQVTEFGSLKCTVHSGKTSAKNEKQHKEEKCYQAEMIPWMKILSRGIVSLLHYSHKAIRMETLEAAMLWLAELGALFIAQGGALSEREMRHWLSQEKRNSDMTIALVHSLGKKQLLWLLKLMDQFGTDEQKHSLHLASLWSYWADAK